MHYTEPPLLSQLTTLKGSFRRVKKWVPKVFDSYIHEPYFLSLAAHFWLRPRFGLRPKPQNRPWLKVWSQSQTGSFATPAGKNSKSPMPANGSCKMCFQHLGRDRMLELLVAEPSAVSRPTHRVVNHGRCHRPAVARELAAHQPAWRS